MRRGTKPSVHWLSPLPKAQTDIAHYTHRILPELAANTNLTLWTDAYLWDCDLERQSIVRRLDPDGMLPRDLAQTGVRGRADPVFVHIGNSWEFHAGFLRLIQRLPTIIVLHDLAIQELFFDAIQYHLLDRSQYEAGMARWHGEAGLAEARRVFDGQTTPLGLAQHYPGFELVLDRAVAVLVHTKAAFDAVKAVGIAPVYQLDLPFRPSGKRPSAARSATGPLRLVQFGYIGPNRRLEQVLHALSHLRNEVDFRLDIFGQLWDQPHITDLLGRLDLSDRVCIRGFVAEAELDHALAEAHLVFNLRQPTMGEASGSQLRIWNAAAAAVVSDLGWYSTLPDNTVFKLPIDQEQPALLDLLRRLHADRNLGQARGHAGRLRLENHHTPARYAEGVAAIAERFSEDAALSVLARSARKALAASPAHPGMYATSFSRRMAER